MSYGFRVKNTNSELQIDGNYINYVYNEQSGSLTLNGLSTITLTNPTPFPPIVLLRPTSASDRACGVFDYTYSSPNYTHVRVFGGQQAFDSGTCSFDYKIYTVTDVNSSDTYGFRVRNEQGKIVFDAGKIPFKILEVGTATIDSTYTHSSHSDPFYVFSPWLSAVVGFRFAGQGPVYRLVGGIAKVSSTSTIGRWVIVGRLGITNMNFIDYQAMTFTLIVCDSGA